MSLAAPMTFGSAIRAVFVRCSVSTVGNQHASYLDLVREFVRSAHTQLYPEAEWTSALSRVEIALSSGVQTYDWPDDTMPGRINFAAVRKADGFEVQLDFGIRPNERTSSKTDGAVQTGCPRLLTYVGGNLELWVAPDANWTTLVVDYVKAKQSLVDDADELIVDGELTVQAATMKFKRHLGLPVTNEDVAEHERYLARVKGMQSSGGGWQFGGHQSCRLNVRKRNRIGGNWPSVGGTVPYTDDWTPF